MGGETIGAAIGAALFELAVARGADRGALIERSGVDPAVLADPDARIAFADYVRLMRTAQVLTGDPALALHFGEEVDPADLSIVASLGSNSASAADAFAELNRFAPLGFDVGVTGAARMELVRQDGSLWLVDRRADPDGFPELTESTFARIACGARRHGFDLIREVQVTHRAPAYRAEYARVFGVPVAFGRAWNALRMDDAMLAVRMAPQPRDVRAALVERAERLLAELPATATLRGKVERLVLRGLEDGPVRAAAIAAALNMSRQTLHRRLRGEGTTFEQLLDEVRHRLARRELDAGTPIDRIAERLAFADRVSFSRAFKRWTGLSPRAGTSD